MKFSTQTLLPNLLTFLAASACRQLQCNASICAKDPDAGANTICDLYAQNKNSKGVSLVGRDGCGWAKITSFVRNNRFCGLYEVLISGDFAIWRANDIVPVEVMQRLSYIFVGSEHEVGNCKVRRNVDC